MAGILVDARDLLNSLHRVINQARDLTPALRGAAAALELQAARHFDSAGDWPPLNPETLARRRRAGITSTDVLEATGRLRRSLTGRSAEAVRDVRGNELVFGTTVPYAPYVAGRRDPLPDVDRGVEGRIADLIADHVFEGIR
jgi:phage gpG-like protein